MTSEVPPTGGGPSSCSASAAAAARDRALVLVAFLAAVDLVADFLAGVAVFAAVFFADLAGARLIGIIVSFRMGISSV